ncbi:helix-turn-helix domain-containing protein [Cytobacillus sp. IB215665]|uniref:helix-turn-helix domain-containing protein n=1 Tax=Cytobacillus sp. IB215665 TaxID=3097357 RepID=UPI002A110A0A|nr:helix-turn-helix domain-containing protein [Cytobacillus sp. IB215665]MDX8367174.1 helix-turn-helix domain-containing protein [Cytobacillus sp. IB215665]
MEYREDRYIHYRNVPTGEYNIVPVNRDGKVLHIQVPIFKKQEISFDEIKQLNLDDYGKYVEACAEDVSFVHNYFFDFWGAIMGAEAIALYLLLKRYCNNKDYCSVDMQTIQMKMKKGSKNSIIKYLNTLEKFGFITKIQRIDLKKNNSDTSPFYKIRRNIPLLSKELAETLPEKLRIEHDEFLESNNTSLDESTNSDQKPVEMLKSSQVVKSRKKKSSGYVHAIS